MKFETYAHWHENKGRQPLRSFREMADEFSVDWKKLRGVARQYNAPQAVLMNNGTNTTKNRWYKPAEFRAWFKSLPEDVRARLTAGER